jgi:hypothetical protein
LGAGNALARRSAIAHASVDPEDTLIASVVRRSLTTAESDAKRLWWKNVKAVRLAIELSEREASTKAEARRHFEEQERLLRRLAGVQMDLLDDDGGKSSFDDNNDDPPAVEDYTGGQSSTVSRKVKGTARKW